MSVFSTQFNPKYLEAIKQFRLIDDTFFDVCFDDNIEGMQLLLRIFLQRTDIIVKEVEWSIQRNRRVRVVNA